MALFVRRKSSKVFARIRSMKVLSFPTDEASCGDDDDFSDLEDFLKKSELTNANTVSLFVY